MAIYSLHDAIGSSLLIALLLRVCNKRGGAARRCIIFTKNEENTHKKVSITIIHVDRLYIGCKFLWSLHSHSHLYSSILFRTIHEDLKCIVKTYDSLGISFRFAHAFLFFQFLTQDISFGLSVYVINIFFTLSSSNYFNSCTLFLANSTVRKKGEAGGGERLEREGGGGGSLACQLLFFGKKKKKSGDFSQVFVGLSQNVGTANQITSVS